MQVFHITTRAEFDAMIKTAQPGDHIKLAGVDFGDLRLSNVDYGSGITISALDPFDPPVINTMSLWNVHGLTLENLLVDFTPTAETLEHSSALRADNSSRIVIKDSHFIGGDSVAGISPESEPGMQDSSGILGYPIGRAITLLNSSEITIENNTIEHFASGIRVGNIDGLIVSNNDIFNFRQVAIGGGNVSNATLDQNHFHDANPWNYGGLGDHGDYIHFWTTASQEKPSTNINISNNFLSQGEGTGLMGVYLNDKRSGLGFENVVISENIISSTNSQALRLHNVNGLEVLGNTILPIIGEDTIIPRVLLVSATDAVIDRNIMVSLVGNALQDVVGNNIQIGDNLFVQWDFPGESNYIGNLFANSLSLNPILNDYQIIPGSLAEGYGPVFSALLGSADQAMALISIQAGTGRESHVHNFTVDDFLEEASTLAGAQVNWDFGDGKVASGMAVQHLYGETGFYNATATVTLASGEIMVLERTIDVRHPIALSLDFEGDVTAGISAIHGAATFVSSDKGTSLALGGDKGYISIERSTEFLQNSAFSINFALQKNMADIGGRVFYLSGTAVVDIGDDSITLRGRTDNAESIVLAAVGIGIADTEWHHVTYAFDQSSGIAALYVNGDEVARQDGLTGSQAATGGHTIHLGNPFGASFEGLVDDVSFLKYALLPEQVKSIHAGISFEDLEQPNTFLPLPEAEPKPEPEREPEPEILKGVDVPEEGLPERKESSSIIAHDPVQLGATGVASSISRSELSELFIQQDIAVNFSIGADMAGKTGEVFRLHGSLLVDVNRMGELQVRAWSSEGDYVILRSGSDMRVNDGEHHDIDIQLIEGRLSLWVNDEIRSEASFGGSFRDRGAHDLTFGNPWHGAERFFDGSLSDFSISVGTDIGTTNMNDPFSSYMFFQDMPLL